MGPDEAQEKRIGQEAPSETGAPRIGAHRVPNPRPSGGQSALDDTRHDFRAGRLWQRLADHLFAAEDPLTVRRVSVIAEIHRVVEVRIDVARLDEGDLDTERVQLVAQREAERVEYILEGGRRCAYRIGRVPDV